MKKIILIGLFSLFAFNCYSQEKNIYLVFDNDVPDTIPKVYASNFFSRDSSYIGYCSFSEAEECFYYAVTNRQWESSRILKLSFDGKIDTVKFNINKNWEGEPYNTPDGQRLYITAKPPKKIPSHEVLKDGEVIDAFVPPKMDCL